MLCHDVCKSLSKISSTGPRTHTHQTEKPFTYMPMWQQIHLYRKQPDDASRTPRRRSLQSHMGIQAEKTHLNDPPLTHSGKKPFMACPWVNEKFRQRNPLVRHLRIIHRREALQV
ncbi:hypothetical protein AVEN_162438-1 [Araneus ventricosus]|uniref:C2H2-type domain-containing protein n=1 Tax=Araneus ventricosus TaxID=182803 RepID=A0A4Y2WUT8_ARAVE|nr:hypothetical protein AVEN_162438-1 [Araneus ventricosus]